MEIKFDKNAVKNAEIEASVKAFLKEVPTAEQANKTPIYIYQDGVKKSYYIRCAIDGGTMFKMVSLDARLDPDGDETFRDNRELMLNNSTFMRMRADAEKEREFNDVIAEYVKSYLPGQPLKVWGGQHRSKAVTDAYEKKGISRYHGFRVYFNLTKEQRIELALISNINIAASNDLFDRQVEETYMGPSLRKWCVKIGLLRVGEDFPDVGSRAERITTQLARSFIVNYFKGKHKGEQVTEDKLDANAYEPYLCQSGVFLDEEYRKLTEQKGGQLWNDKGLLEAGKAFNKLHRAQSEAIKTRGYNCKSFRMKALSPSVLSAWSYIAGLLQSHPSRLQVHLSVPQPPKGAADPLNAEEMAKFRYYQDLGSVRGLGTKSALKDRQRMAQVFLARSIDPAATLERKLLTQAVNQATALKFFSKGYTS